MVLDSIHCFYVLVYLLFYGHSNSDWCWIHNVSNSPSCNPSSLLILNHQQPINKDFYINDNDTIYYESQETKTDTASYLFSTQNKIRHVNPLLIINVSRKIQIKMTQNNLKIKIWNQYFG